MGVPPEKVDVYLKGILNARKGFSGDTDGVDAVREADERRRALLHYLSGHPAARLSSVVRHFGVSRSTLDRNVRALKREGLLRGTGSTSGVAWQVIA